jgi:ATP-dependent RNA helicase SUPV3L1/SUV3
MPKRPQHGSKHAAPRGGVKPAPDWAPADVRGRRSPTPVRGPRPSFGIRERKAAALREALDFTMPHPLPGRRVVAHLGPTNSGKTRAAIDALAEHGVGAYGAPLRMLAQEAYERLADMLGPARVGLRTGEERINGTGPSEPSPETLVEPVIEPPRHPDVLACTTELLPSWAPFAVLDEMHWIADPERGPAWTRALLHSGRQELRVVGSVDALPLLVAAVPDIEIHIHERLLPLDWIGPVPVSAIEPGTVIVAFSRAAVLALARELSTSHRGRVGALYGAMPIGARREQIAAFISGQTEVLVATDVLGHGVNLPCRTVLFAETSKYDGVERRPLAAWEIAQIAGRAGRFGLAEDGRVGVLAGVRWANPEPARVRDALTPQVVVEHDAFGLPIMGHRRITKATFGPTAADLGAIEPVDWPAALEVWAALANASVASHPWLRVADVGPMRGRLEALGPRLLREISPSEAWTFALAPIDPDRGELLASFGDALVHGASLAGLADPGILRDATLEEAEGVAGFATALRWFTQRFGDVGGVTHEEAVVLERRASERASALLGHAIRENRYGRCSVCGKATAPWFRTCDGCRDEAREAREARDAAHRPQPGFARGGLPRGNRGWYAQRGPRTTGPSRSRES